MKRRYFLKQSSLITLASLGLLHLPKNALASSLSLKKNHHFFVLIQAPGGWDTSLSIDPHSHANGTTQDDIFLEYRENDIFNIGDQFFFAPAAQSMIKHSQDIHIVRGIEMRRDAGHTTNLEIIASGAGDGLSAFFPVELAASTTKGPMGVLTDNSILTGFHQTPLTTIGSITNGVEENAEDLFNAMYIDEDDLFSQVKDDLFTINGKSKKLAETMSELSAQGFSDSSFTAIASAFVTNASFQASISINEQNLDTHSQHETNHLNAQKNVWEQISTLFDYFKQIEYSGGKSLFDHTTFLVVSEFTRTPALNSAAGKDHNPHANSVLFAGKGVQGGQTTGETFIIPKAKSKISIAEHLSRPINFKTGDVIKSPDALSNNDVHLIFPENIRSTLGSIFKNPNGFYKNQKRARTIPGVIKT